MPMELISELKAAALLCQEAAQEVLWPTRCAICDTPGTLLCPTCRVRLPFIDQLKACPICGAASGCAICCECNRFILDWKHLERFPLDGCVSATTLDAQTRRLIICYKDRNEQRLAPILAQYLFDSMPYAWRSDSLIVPVPARKQALRTRGFDHMELVAQNLHKISGVPFAIALTPSKRKDQRGLDARGRLKNTAGSFELQSEHAHLIKRAQRIIIIDDVLTTGATLFAAAEALRINKDARIYGLTFARA